MHEGRGVEQLAADRHRHAEREDGRRIAGLVGKALELATLTVEEAAPLHQVFRWIAADDLFGKRRDGDVLVSHLAGEADQPGDVRRDGTNRGAYARHGQFR